MKQNLKVNLVWLGLLVAGFALIQVLLHGCASTLSIQILYSKSELILSLQLA